MARGWESKSVESQIEDSNAYEPEPGARARDELELSRRRDEIELSRRRVARELAASHSPVHRTALENALRHLDGELSKLR